MSHIVVARNGMGVRSIQVIRESRLEVSNPVKGRKEVLREVDESIVDSLELFHL